MKRANKKRLTKLSQQIDAMPIAPAVEDAAFDQFRETGELPEHQRLAAAVTGRALRGGAVRRHINLDDEDARMMRLGDRVREILESKSKPPTDPIRKQLFNEAVYGPSFIRRGARVALETLVAIGLDVTDPNFLGEYIDVPDYGSVGLHILGFPECLVMPPHEVQAQRVLDDFTSLRQRIDRDDRRWFDDVEKAESLFLNEGQLPDDEVMREAVLASGEFAALLIHHCGQGDTELLAAFDVVAGARDEVQSDAIAKVQAMAAEGRLVSGDP